MGGGDQNPYQGVCAQAPSSAALALAVGGLPLTADPPSQTGLATDVTLHDKGAPTHGKKSPER